MRPTPYRLTYTGLLLVVATCLLLLASARAHAAPVVDREITLSKNANRLAQGPDGNMWATLAGVMGNEIARITPQGDVTEFDNDTLSGAVGIVTGPDGKLWVTIGTKVVRFDPASPTTPAPPTDVFAADIVQPQSIVVGPDGNLWTASADKVLRITPAGIVTPFTVLTGARGIASAGGLLWVADFGAKEIVSVTTDGAPTRYPVGEGGPQEVAAGLDGQIGFTNPGARVGRLIAGSTPLQTDAAPGSDPFGIAFGADQAYWFAQPFGNDLGRLTTDGRYSRLGGFSPDSGPRYVAAGPGDTLWVALHGVGGVEANKVARVSGVEFTPPPLPPRSTLVPAVSKLRLSAKRFRVGKARTVMVARKRGKVGRVPVGTTIRFSLNKRATVRLAFARKAAGRKRGGRCVKPTRALREARAKRCTRHVKVGRLIRRDLATGKHALRFSGRIGRRALPAGSYRVSAIATDAGGLRSKPRAAKFSIAAPN